MRYLLGFIILFLMQKWYNSFIIPVYVTDSVFCVFTTSNVKFDIAVTCHHITYKQDSQKFAV